MIVCATIGMAWFVYHVTLYGTSCPPMRSAYCVTLGRAFLFSLIAVLAAGAASIGLVEYSFARLKEKPLSLGLFVGLGGLIILFGAQVAISVTRSAWLELSRQ